LSWSIDRYIYICSYAFQGCGQLEEVGTIFNGSWELDDFANPFSEILTVEGDLITHLKI